MTGTALPAIFAAGCAAALAAVAFTLSVAGIWPAVFAPVAFLGLAGLTVLTAKFARVAAAASAGPSELATREALDQLREDFLATLSHELRTPLNAMIGWVHLLRMKAPVDPGHALDAIERNARQQAQLIDDLLDVSRILKGGLSLELTRLDLHEATRAAVSAMAPAAKAKQIQITLRTPAGTSPVRGDMERLQQAIRNLISNAIKFTGVGGRIDVTVTRTERIARLEVRDFGQGIDPSFVPYVFKLFRQGPATGVRAGLGLGLSIVEEIVHRHAGSVTAESAGRGLGTVVRVVLPLDDTGPARSESVTFVDRASLPAARRPVVRSTSSAGAPRPEAADRRGGLGPSAGAWTAAAPSGEDLPPVAWDAWDRPAGVRPAG